MKKSADPGVINGKVNVPSKGESGGLNMDNKNTGAFTAKDPGIPTSQKNPFVPNKGSSKGGENMGDTHTGKFTK